MVYKTSGTVGQEAAEYIREHVTKPVVGYVVGISGRVKEWLSPPPPHQTVRTDFPYTAFVWHCPIAGDGFIN